MKSDYKCSGLEQHRFIILQLCSSEVRNESQGPVIKVRQDSIYFWRLKERIHLVLFQVLEAAYFPYSALLASSESTMEEEFFLLMPSLWPCYLLPH